MQPLQISQKAANAKWLDILIICMISQHKEKETVICIALISEERRQKNAIVCVN